jgi:hypothetical protein
MAQAFAEPAPKVSICHFDEEEGAWLAISISAQGASAHLRNHDDGLPGATTAVTGTQLDAACAVGAPAPEQPASEEPQ